MRVPYRTCVWVCVHRYIWILCSYYLYVIHEWQTNARITVLIQCAQSSPAAPGWGGAFRKDNTESSDRILETFYERLQQPFPDSGRQAERSDMKNWRKFLPVVPVPYKTASDIVEKRFSTAAVSNGVSSPTNIHYIFLLFPRGRRV